MDETVARVDGLIGALRSLLHGIASTPCDLLPATQGPASAPEPAALPVLSVLPTLWSQAPRPVRPAIEALLGLAPDLQWRQTYGVEAGDAFLRNYGWTELAGPKGLRLEPGFSAGLLLLGPDTLYPAHNHPALEYYVPLSGTADWFDEDLGWRPVAPLQLITHRPMVRHAMRTGGQPLFAYYLWSGEGLGVSAKLTDH